MARRKSRKSSESKYNSTKTKCKIGHIHDSKVEAERCNELSVLAKEGKISNLETQVAFEVIPKFSKLGEMASERNARYIADFTYSEDGTFIIEDVKSKATSEDNVYILKRKLMKSIYCREGSGTIFREVIRNEK